MFLTILFIIIVLFLIGYFSKEETTISKIKNFNQNNKENTSGKTSDETAIGIHLAIFTLMMLEKNNTLCKTLAEKREVLCFLIYANNLSIQMKFSNNLEKAVKISFSFYMSLLELNKEILTSNFINSRLELYKKCKCLITSNSMLPGPGSAFLVLSHFLKIAKGNIIEKDVIDVLVGKSDIREDILDQFLDLPETLNLVIIMSNLLIIIKKSLDELCKNFNT